MEHLQKKQSNRKLVKAFEITAIPVGQEDNFTGDLRSCLSSILYKSHAGYDFAVEILYLACKSEQRVNGSQCRIILTVFAYGEGKYGKSLVEMFDKRAASLDIVLRKHNYTVQELSPAQLEEIHAHLLACPYKNILAPRRNSGMTDARRPVCTLAVDMASGTAVSLLFTRDLYANSCRVTSLVIAQTKEEALLCIKPYFPWPFLRPNVNRKGCYLQRRLDCAKDLNRLSQVCKSISWKHADCLLQLPAGTTYGLPCSAPLSLDVTFPKGMLNCRPEENAVYIGHTAGGNASVSLTHDQLSRHICVLGQTGSGKSTFLSQMLLNCKRAGSRVLILDLAGSMEFRKLCQIMEGDIYTFHDQVSPYAVNPLSIEGFSLDEVRKILSRIFEENLSFFEPLPMLSKQVFSMLDKESSYSDVPTFIAEYMRIFDLKSNYASDVKTNLRSSMYVRLQSLESLFGSAQTPFDPGNFFRTNHLIEMHRATEAEKTFFLAYVLNVLFSYVQKLRGNGLEFSPLIICIDELHTLLCSNKDDASRAALLRLFERLINEGRKLGLWFLLADQKWEILQHVFESVGTKIVFKTDTACSDIARLLREPYAEKHLPVLAPGEMYCRAPSMEKAVWLKVPPTSINQVISGKVMHNYMMKRGRLLPEPTPSHAHSVIVPKVNVEKRLVSMEEEAKRIAFKDVLSTVINYFYKATDKERDYLVKGFRLEEYLANACHATDPALIAAVRTHLREAINSLQFLTR